MLPGRRSTPVRPSSAPRRHVHQVRPSTRLKYTSEQTQPFMMDPTWQAATPVCPSRAATNKVTLFWGSLFGCVVVKGICQGLVLSDYVSGRRARSLLHVLVRYIPYTLPPFGRDVGRGPELGRRPKGRSRPVDKVDRGMGTALLVHRLIVMSDLQVYGTYLNEMTSPLWPAGVAPAGVPLWRLATYRHRGDA